MKSVRTAFALIAFSLAAADAAAGQDLVITDAWTTPSLTENATGAVFLTVTNNTDKSVSITGGSSPLADRVELHSMRTTHDGMMSMDRLLQAEVPAMSRLQFKPNDLHVMLIGIKHKLKAGDTLPLTLQLARQSSISTQVEVRPLAAKLQTEDTEEAQEEAAEETPAPKSHLRKKH